MPTKSMSGRAAGIVSILAVTALVGCGGNDSDDRRPEEREWEWTTLGGPGTGTPSLVANHETLVVSGGTLLIGTEDGVWRRPLEGNAEWERSGLDGRAIHALAVDAGGTRIVAAGYDPRDQHAPTAWYSTSGGLDWTPAAVYPQGSAGGATAAYRFASLEPDPLEAGVLYGGLDGDTVAITVDGGATWFLANEAELPSFGYPCVAHRPRTAAVLLQGCEMPLDVAWIGAYDVAVDNRFTLTGFRYLFGYPDLTELGDRRINAIVPVPGRDDRVLVGVEGGLLELSTRDGRWSTRDTVGARVIYRSDVDTASRPYVYVRAIAPLSADGRHVLFGGTLNDMNRELALFETSNGGVSVWRVEGPPDLLDPRVEQAIALGARDVLLVVSAIDARDLRTSLVYRLRRE
jgi:hypothetical protein